MEENDMRAGMFWILQATVPTMISSREPCVWRALLSADVVRPSPPEIEIHDTKSSTISWTYRTDLITIDCLARLGSIYTGYDLGKSSIWSRAGDCRHLSIELLRALSTKYFVWCWEFCIMRCQTSILSYEIIGVRKFEGWIPCLLLSLISTPNLLDPEVPVLQPGDCILWFSLCCVACCLENRMWLRE